MKYSDIGFRGINGRFFAIPLKDMFRESAEAFPGIEGADHLLTYGYIDHQAGVTLEIIAGAQKKGESMVFADTNETVKSMIRIGAAEDGEFYYFADEDGSLKERYSSKLEVLSTYDVNEEIEETRKMGFLDHLRHPQYPDDIQVQLIRDGLNIEVCWVRLEGLGDHFLIGELLNEPNQDFGYHMGERIAIFITETEEKKVICYANLNPSQKLTAADLEDGSMLKNAIASFEADRNQDNLITIMEILRDSYLWVPCNAVMSDEDYEQVEKMVKENEDDLESLIGTTMKTKGAVRMIPDILQNGEAFFFPAFTSTEDMGEYGEHFSKMQKHMLEIIPLARNNEKDVKGIVINAFSQPFILDAELFDLVEKMKSRIVE